MERTLLLLQEIIFPSLPFCRGIQEEPASPLDFFFHSLFHSSDEYLIRQVMLLEGSTIFNTFLWQQ